jgi:type VI secretion system protein ImpF
MALEGEIMKSSQTSQHIRLSVFDRLAREPAYGVIGASVSDIEIVRRAVLRDVENLLNTRRRIVSPPGSYHFVKDSLYVYGLEDFVTKNPKSPQVRKALKSSIERTLERFEPRLKNVSVAFNPAEGNEQQLCFTISATLHADPVREPIFFDTWFSVNRGEYKILSQK